MKIVADRNIFRVEEYFSAAGDLLLLPGREITPDKVKDADALLVRTVTNVNEELVENSSLRFIGSATSGMDHVDRAVLDTHDIHFAHAPGCNADAVVDYVFSALAWASRQRGLDWRQARIGIIGAGNVGGRLAGKCTALGMAVAVYDPLLGPGHPLANHLVTFEEALQCDVITLHTPLATDGPYPTRHMLDARVLEGLSEHAVLINASRGEVIDNSALTALLDRRDDLAVILDVWEGEPAIDQNLARKIFLGTPHIAGYSLNGKLNATTALYEAYCRFFDVRPAAEMQDDPKPVLSVAPAEDENTLLEQIMLEAYPVQDDGLEISGAGAGPELAALFDSRRNGYFFRREYGDCEISGEGMPQGLAADLVALGFRLSG